VRAAAVLLAIAAAIATAGLALLGDTSRALHGSDTRASGLLLGAVVALALPPSVWRRHAAGARARRLRVLGLLVLAAMLAVIVAVAPYPRWVPRGGLFVVALLSAVLIAAVVRSAELDRLLGAGPLRWMGRRSLALYLWHWPVLVAIGGPAALPDARIVALYLAVSMVLADATHRFVEAPLRRVQEGDGGGRRTRASVAVGATAVACGVAMVAALLAGQGRPAGAGSAQRAWPFPYASRDSGGR
jgi:peptidoglycan/LPS O-acetylase OafA/YrhL